MKKIIFYFFLVLISSCSLAPKYHVPPVVVPKEYKESGKWLQAKPQVAELSRGSWWQIYHDPTLNNLEEKVVCANQNIKAALARFDQARAAVMIARSDLFPTINGEINANRVKTSNTVLPTFSPTTFNDFVVAGSFNYEVDLWGKIRNSIVAAKSFARASAADLAALDLSLHAELASNYFLLRGRDNSQRILDDTVAAYQKSLFLVNQRHKEGAVSISDVYQAESQLETAKTAAADNHMKRAQLEHAIAILIGVPPGCFTLPVIKNWKIPLVTISPDLPSTLLERRPDIAENEEFVRAANANIGVARTAYFPDINLAGGMGYESSFLSKLFKAPSLIWAIGPLSNLRSLGASETKPLILQTLFDGGEIRGMNVQAWGKYRETVANYRQTVLNAFQDVEDSLIAVRQLDKENLTQTAATKAAENSLKQALYQYRGGIINYLDVIVVQNITLQAELSLVNVQTARHISSVSLIKALGGGWHSCFN